MYAATRYTVYRIYMTMDVPYCPRAYHNGAYEAVIICYRCMRACAIRPYTVRIWYGYGPCTGCIMNDLYKLGRLDPWLDLIDRALQVADVGACRPLPAASCKRRLGKRPKMRTASVAEIFSFSSLVVAGPCTTL